MYLSVDELPPWRIPSPSEKGLESSSCHITTDLMFVYMLNCMSSTMSLSLPAGVGTLACLYVTQHQKPSICPLRAAHCCRWSVSARAARTGGQSTVKLNCSLLWFRSSGGSEWVIMCNSTTFPSIDVMVIFRYFGFFAFWTSLFGRLDSYFPPCRCQAVSHGSGHHL